jgi:hypothetical protein
LWKQNLCQASTAFEGVCEHPKSLVHFK